jgi:hypothetical protein
VRAAAASSKRCIGSLWPPRQALTPSVRLLRRLHTEVAPRRSEFFALLEFDWKLKLDFSVIIRVLAAPAHFLFCD